MPAWHRSTPYLMLGVSSTLHVFQAMVCAALTRIAFTNPTFLLLFAAVRHLSITCAINCSIHLEHLHSLRCPQLYIAVRGVLERLEFPIDSSTQLQLGHLPRACPSHQWSAVVCGGGVQQDARNILPPQFWALLDEKVGDRVTWEWPLVFLVANLDLPHTLP